MRNWKELLASATALRRGIDNTPKSKKIIACLKHSFKQLRKIEKIFPRVKVNSGFRNIELNKAVGGEKYSQHLTGKAMDLDFPNNVITKKDLMNLYIWIRDNLDYDQLIQEHFPYGWIHVSFNPNGKNRKLNLKKVTGVPGYSRVT